MSSKSNLKLEFKFHNQKSTWDEILQPCNNDFRPIGRQDFAGHSEGSSRLGHGLTGMHAGAVPSGGHDNQRTKRKVATNQPSATETETSRIPSYPTAWKTRRSGDQLGLTDRPSPATNIRRGSLCRESHLLGATGDKRQTVLYSGILNPAFSFTKAYWQLVLVLVASVFSSRVL
jgi:hypothetical protein